MIRRATVNDVPFLVALQAEIEAESAIWGYRGDSHDDWHNRDLAWTLVATSANGQPVAFIHATSREYAGECVFPSTGRILEIVELAVTLDFRQRGIGRKLVTALCRHALNEGITHLRVYSAAKRFDDIVRFYRSCGFAPWYVELTQELGPDIGKVTDDELAHTADTV